MADTPPGAGLYLWLDPSGLHLCRAGRPVSCLRVDFLGGDQGYRAGQLGRQRELVARACGIRGNAAINIVDATAGLGRDGFVLAGLGARVTLIERSPVVACLLEDGLARARQGGLDGIASRIRLVHDDALPWLQGLPADRQPDVIYLDPMYSDGRRRAAAGKALALLQTLLGDDGEATPLLNAATGIARDRVVVKRQRRAPPLGERPPDYALKGRSTRFDVYRVNAARRADAGEY